MAAGKHIERICAAITVLCVVLTILFMNGEALGLQPASRAPGYEARLFDPARVHTIDIVIDDWDAFLSTARNEEYAVCSLVIDNEAYKNVALRGKGNTSLSTVASLGSERYSLKVEFDHYDPVKTYYGLDKLSLNNVIQDNTYMKDYLTYRMMAAFDVNAPLCSFVYLTVNGEDWGLYLAVEGVEDGFLQRNYGRDHGDLYKPDSMSFGGGRGNGRDFNMEDFMGGAGQSSSSDKAPAVPDGFAPGDMPDGFEPGKTPDGFASGDMPGGDPNAGGFAPGSKPDGSIAPGDMTGGFEPGDMPDGDPNAGGFVPGSMPGGFAPGGMGAGDVKLQYIDDDPNSYPNIFGSAKTDVTQADQARLIRSLKALGEGGDVSKVLDIDQVLRYFVVHNFVVNGDSYTGSMVHNYYLYEEDGRLSMLPWDYNLAFGTFQGGSGSAAVNDPIDSPLSSDGSGERPMVDWIFSSEEYTALYHRYFEEFLRTVDPAAIIDEARALIAPYVERDPTRFCTVEEFELGVKTLKDFCMLRAQSVAGQLNGTIPSTDAGRSESQAALVDASSLDLSRMGTMNGGGFGGGPDDGPGGRPDSGFGSGDVRRR